MSFDRIENLKQQYTDQYVVVDATRPELARFRDVVGRVKTVNMSGRALVEFLDYHANIGWYDIDPDFLTIVDEPPPKAKEAPAGKAPARKPAGEVPPVKPSGGKVSTADILAAARGKAAKPQAKKPTGETSPAKGPGGKPSTADILAAARGKAAKPQAKKPTGESIPGEVAAATGKESAPPTPEPQPEATSIPEKPAEKVDQSSMTVAEKIAWCRAHDAK